MRVLTGITLLLCATMIMSSCTRKRSHRLTEIPAQVESGKSKSEVVIDKKKEVVEVVESQKMLDEINPAKEIIEREILKNSDCDILDKVKNSLLTVAKLTLSHKTLDQNQCLMTIKDGENITHSAMGDCDFDEEKFIEIIKSFKTIGQIQLDRQALSKITDRTAHQILSALCENKSEDSLKIGDKSLEAVREEDEDAKECQLILTNGDLREETIGTLDAPCDLLETINKFKKMLTTPQIEEKVVVPDDEIIVEDAVEIEL